MTALFQERFHPAIAGQSQPSSTKKQILISTTPVLSFSIMSIFIQIKSGLVKETFHKIQVMGKVKTYKLNGFKYTWCLRSP
jgi:hypothetical protein